jgi:hypothetical protein
MSDERFGGVPRGRALRGAREIAAYIFDDADAVETVFALPRDEFGLITLGRDLTGFSNWVDLALAARARASKARKRSHKANAETVASA